MRRALVFETERTSYGIEHVRDAITVGELKRFLEDIDDDTLFILSYDNGSIGEAGHTFFKEDEDGEWTEDEW